MGIFDFNSIKKSLRGAEEHLKQIRKQIENLKREREDLASAPAHRDDVKNMVREWLGDCAAEHVKRLTVNMREIVAKPQKLEKRDGRRPLMTLAGAYTQTGGGIVEGGQAVDGALCAFLGPALLEGVLKVIDQMDWPGVEGLPMAVRGPKIAKLDKEISQLVAEETELVEVAKSIGLAL